MHKVNIFRMLIWAAHADQETEISTRNNKDNKFGPEIFFILSLPIKDQYVLKTDKNPTFWGYGFVPANSGYFFVKWNIRSFQG